MILFFRSFSIIDGKLFWNDRNKLSQFGQKVWKYRLMNIFTASFNTIVRKMTEMSQQRALAMIIAACSNSLWRKNRQDQPKTSSVYDPWSLLLKFAWLWHRHCAVLQSVIGQALELIVSIFRLSKELCVVFAIMGVRRGVGGSCVPGFWNSTFFYYITSKKRMFY